MHIRHGADDGEERDNEKLNPVRERAKVPWASWQSITTLDDVVALESCCLGEGELTRGRDAGSKGVTVVGDENSDEVDYVRYTAVAEGGTSGTIEDQIEVGAHRKCESEGYSHEQGTNQVYRSADGVLGSEFKRAPN